MDTTIENSNSQQVEDVGGSDMDSQRAGELLAAAVVAGDTDAIKQAVFDQNAALINKSMTTVIPTLKSVLESVLKAQIGALTTRMDKSDSARLKRNAQFQDHLDHRFDAFGEELTMAVGLVQEVQASQATFQDRLTGTEARVTAIEADSLAIHASIARLEAVNDRLAKIEAHIAGSRRDEIGKLRAELDALKQARGDGS